MDQLHQRNLCYEGCGRASRADTVRPAAGRACSQVSLLKYLVPSAGSRITASRCAQREVAVAQRLLRAVSGGMRVSSLLQPSQS